MTTSTTEARAVPQTDRTWLRLIQVSLVVGVVACVAFAYLGTFTTTISDGGHFRYTADYWYTGMGLPFALVGIGHTLGIHRLQHGADGRLGTTGVWINAIALAALFVQLSASLVASTEEQWGPSYIASSFLTFLGTALLAAGSWRTGLLPRWMLGLWPVAWILGTFAAPGPAPLLLAVFFVVLGIRLSRHAG